MKKVIVAVATCALMFACTPGDKNNGAGLSLTESTVPAGAVDLGMVMHKDDGTPYNLYWATSNLSENGLCPNPEDSGDYYAWGETETRIRFYVSGFGYKFTPDSSYKQFSKYCTQSEYGTVDNKLFLEPEDDVAHVKLGGNWRMPTKAEWMELFNVSSWAWTTENGVNGIKVTGPNGNSFFLPAAGIAIEKDRTEVGSEGHYWSSQVSWQDPSESWGVLFDSSSVDDDAYRESRYLGFSVRPVSEYSQNKISQ